MLDHSRLGMRVVLIGSGGVRDYGRIELVAEFASQLGEAPLGVLRELLCGGSVLNGADSFPRMVLEISQHRFEFFLHLSDIVLLLFPPFSGEPCLLSLEFLLAGL